MYRLTIFLLISCVVNRQLIGAVRGGESLSGRNNLYFDAYDHGYPEGEEGEESEGDFRDAVLMHPEEVIDIPLIPDERDYEMLDFGNDTSLNDYPDARSEITRNFLQDLVEQIQSAFGKLPSGIANQGHNQMGHMPVLYHLDDSLHDPFKKMVKNLIDVIEEKSCVQFIQENYNPSFIVHGEKSCTTRMDGRKIFIGEYCFDSITLANSIFNLSELCERIPMSNDKSGIYLSSFRNKAQEESECVDKLSNCNRWAQNGGCSAFFQIMSALCPHTCHLCGDSCMDYSSKCGANDTVKDCLLHYHEKRFTCAGTCGICKTTFPDRCVDKVHECEWLAKKGFCSKYPDVMREYCPVSCGYCSPTFCADERSDCSELQRAGACKKIPGLMQKNCSKTCKFCQKGVENPKRLDDNCMADEEFISYYCVRGVIPPTK